MVAKMKYKGTIKIKICAKCKCVMDLKQEKCILCGNKKDWLKLELDL